MCRFGALTQVVRYDAIASRLGEFLGWFLPRDTQRDTSGQGRSFRRRASEFRHVWLMPGATGAALHMLLEQDLLVQQASRRAPDLGLLGIISGVTESP